GIVRTTILFARSVPILFYQEVRSAPDDERKQSFIGAIMPGQKTRGDEPSMYLQRPSTGKSQDVRHILVKTFRELFTRDAIGPETVKNLKVSKGGDDPYHERYVDALQKVFEERQRRMAEAAMLERHIMQAQARAMSADERELNRVADSCDTYHDLGLPPGPIGEVRSHFQTCLDSQLLEKHHLLTPADYATEEPPPMPPPAAEKIPSYARDTLTSRQHTRDDLFLPPASPPPSLARSQSDIGSLMSEEPIITQREREEAYLAQFPRNDAWKQQMSEDKREQERVSLKNLNAMTNYQRNPRHVPPSALPGKSSLIKASKVKAKEVGIKQKEDPTPEPKEPSQVFLVSPPAVVFSDYKVGQVYEFPGDHGLVAPGMSCHYAIRFNPDSLRDFDDEIKIQTQSREPITVPLLGRRPPPKLSIPRVLDIGYCLVGGCQVTQYVVKNNGGHGRFCIVPSSAWPTTNFKSVVRNGHVPIPPFSIRPSVLELGPDQSGLIEIAFQPPAVKSYSVDMAMICDNCNVKHFTLQGQAERAGVELVSVERGTAEPVPGELFDATAQHHINPGAGSAARHYDRVPDVDSVFSVHPPTGVLPPNERMDFKITYAPPVVDKFHMPPFTDVTALEIEVKGESSPLSVVLHPYSIHVPGKNLVGVTVKKMVTMANHSHSTVTFQWEPYTDSYILEVEPPFGELDPGMAMDMELSITGPQPGQIDHTLYCHVMNLEEPLHLQVQAEFKGPEIAVDEPDLNFGLVQLGTMVTKEITINNLSQIITPWTIQDSPATPPHTEEGEDDVSVDSEHLSEFTFEPDGGELKPLESRKVKVTFNPHLARSVRRIVEVTQVCLIESEIYMPRVYKGVPVMSIALLFNQTLLPAVFEWGQGEFSDLRIPCKIEGMDTPLILSLSCDVKGLSVKYAVSTDRDTKLSQDELKLDFGKEVALNSSPKLYLHLTNNTAITAPYSISLENFFSKPPTPPEERKEVKIPVSMTVVGCPLAFQMTSGVPDLKPMVRFGTHVAGTAPTTRAMRVKNNSPYDIRVDWEVFNVDPADSKLMDMVVSYGRPFPLKDSAGNEIVPPTEVPLPVIREPTDYIPNSADTSQQTSREVTELVDDHEMELCVPAPTLEARRPKVVSVFCQKHDGQPAIGPYSISPAQLVIKAKSHATVHVTFTPRPTEDVNSDLECPGYILGYSSLDDPEVKGQEGKVTRSQAYEAAKIRLDMTAHLKPALLSIECAEEEGMRYRSAMSCLLNDIGQVSAESLQISSVMLSNLTLTPLTFRLVTKQPFWLVELDPSSNREGRTRTHETDMHTLKPRHNLIVKVAFQTTQDLLGLISDEYLNNVEIGQAGRKVEVTDNLLVPLHATLTVPQFELTKESLDFGTCLVGQTRELQLMITNTTTSHTYFSVSQESRSDNCADNTFCVEPTSGLLEAHITHDFDAVFTFHGILGESPRRLHVKGEGSYDAKHEAVLNI
ncbi:DLEC1-like protein, partial [Mya arenaria]